ncbi:MAG: haloacid dehalogenase-like hydrolase, partial [Candidatus Taylorbacteria bacterium]|nr:haloacid dehalogenase-like hydrolase [Candidatus Taylorbacteria bacterium]
MKKKVALFDIDGTIFRSSLLIELVEALITEKIFPVQSRSLYTREYRAWQNRRGSYEAYIEAVIATFMKYLKGVSYADFERVGKAVVETHQDQVYCYTRDLAKKLKSRGYFLLAISQSPKGILDAFCKRLGFNKVYGRFYELGPSDKFTGVVTDLHLIANKA